jgi:hypothetical protein
VAGGTVAHIVRNEPTESFLDEVLSELDHGVGAGDPALAIAFLTADLVAGVVETGEAGEVVGGFNLLEGLYFGGLGQLALKISMAFPGCHN